MLFKKILPILNDNAAHSGISELNDFQKSCLPKIKSGKNVVVVAPKGAGKSTTLILHIINKLKQQEGDNPRAIVFVKDKAQALALTERFIQFSTGTDLRIHPIYEERNINNQKDDIYLGTDVVIGTPKRIAKLYFLNGLNIRSVKFLAVEDADFLETTTLHSEITRISESVERAQHIFLAEKSNAKLDRLIGACQDNGHIFERVKD